LSDRTPKPPGLISRFVMVHDRLFFAATSCLRDPDAPAFFDYLLLDFAILAVVASAIYGATH
jgi:hypothetical protein